ncbi:hypothetical protein BKA19_0810 [Blastococcus saxobsidens]|uniref:Uncharacterized protein n=1 Tax=Blastococcus saxobsidens TaxID=138336 RepID=A0A4Q7Y2V5_9ACTN|nr:hypothetical protein BKA19_0810 [Blastococcus saxobsidens]
MPEFPGQRPPFDGPPGNTLALQHGAYSPRVIDPLAEEIRSSVLVDPATDYLAAPRFSPAVWAWARAEAQVQVLTEYLERAAEAAGDGVGDLDQDRVRSAYLLLHRAEARALSGRRALGLDPLAAARLGRDKAAAHVDTARLMAELHRQEQARLAAESERVDGEVVEDGESQ